MTVIPAPVDQVAAVLADLVAGRAYTGPPCTYRAAAVDWLLDNGCIDPTTAALTALGRRMHTMLNRTTETAGGPPPPASLLGELARRQGNPTGARGESAWANGDRPALDAHHDHPEQEGTTTP